LTIAVPRIIGLHPEALHLGIVIGVPIDSAVATRTTGVWIDKTTATQALTEIPWATRPLSIYWRGDIKQLANLGPSFIAAAILAFGGISAKKLFRGAPDVSVILRRGPESVGEY